MESSEFGLVIIIYNFGYKLPIITGKYFAWQMRDMFCRKVLVTVTFVEEYIELF